MSKIVSILGLVIALCITSSKCTSVHLDALDFEKEEAIADTAIKEEIKSAQRDEMSLKTNRQHEVKIDVDSGAFLKPLPKLKVSDEVIKQAISEARAEVELENQKQARDAPQQRNHMTYQQMHYGTKRQRNPEADLKGIQARILEKAMKKIADEYKLSKKQAVHHLNGLKRDFIKKTVCKQDLEERVRCNWRFPYRTVTGVCNNLYNPHWGAANTPFKRLLKPDYADCISKPRESVCKHRSLPNARLLSRKVFTDKNRFSKTFTHFLMNWGQFMDHDITLAQRPLDKKCPNGEQMCTHTGECFGIKVLGNDPDFPKTKCIQMFRNVPAPKEGCPLAQREQINTLTAYIDASNVYGSTMKIHEEVRNSTSCEFLKVQHPDLRFQPLLPPAPKEEFCRSSDKEKNPCFRAGDERNSENQGLASIHTLFVREHNRIATELKKLNKKWSCNRVFQETRKIVGAMLQHITFNEFLPVVLNEKTRKKFGLELLKEGFYHGYSPCLNPSVINSFAGAAYRMGHTLIRNDFSRFGRKQKFPSIPNTNFFNTVFLYDRTNGGVDAILRGLTKDKAMSFDRHIVKAVTANLIIEGNVRIDLPATNIQRGRDHGLPGYNHFRKLCGLKKASTFSDLKEISKKNRKLLKENYCRVDDIDLFAGGVMETSLPGGIVGPTFACIIARQFHDLRRGDRFWYERYNCRTGFTYRQLRELRKVSLARVVCDNSDDIEKVQPRVMQPEKKRNRRINCSKLPKVNFKPWQLMQTEE